MMTEAQIEKAARILCQKHGLDPDKMVPVACPDNRPGCCVTHYGHVWRNYKQSIIQHLMIEEAIQESYAP